MQKCNRPSTGVPSRSFGYGTYNCYIVYIAVLPNAAAGIGTRQVAFFSVNNWMAFLPYSGIYLPVRFKSWPNRHGQTVKVSNCECDMYDMHMHGTSIAQGQVA
jgi:hypothetical protein